MWKKTGSRARFLCFPDVNRKNFLLPVDYCQKRNHFTKWQRNFRKAARRDGPSLGYYRITQKKVSTKRRGRQMTDRHERRRGPPFRLSHHHQRNEDLMANSETVPWTYWLWQCEWIFVLKRWVEKVRKMPNSMLFKMWDRWYKAQVGLALA